MCVPNPGNFSTGWSMYAVWLGQIVRRALSRVLFWPEIWLTGPKTDNVHLLASSSSARLISEVVRPAVTISFTYASNKFTTGLCRTRDDLFLHSDSYFVKPDLAKAFLNSVYHPWPDCWLDHDLTK